MISAELTHNPYLLQTIVAFHGHAPRINSQIEKHLHQTLKNWVHLIPDIFRDEMNGYDFDLNFIGTKPDFFEVEEAFRKAGVSPEQVRLFLKNELEDADVKSGEIDELLLWLSEHRNRKFDYEAFRKANVELFDSTYPYILIRGNAPEAASPQLGMETVRNADEINGTLLTNTPILFYVEESSMAQFRADLTTVLRRRDVSPKQLFFLFHPSVNAQQMKRILIDLGLESPQIVADVCDALVLNYLRNYPVTEYIRQAISVFESAANGISALSDAENRDRKVANADIHAHIENLETILAGLKSADEFFTQRDNYSAPPKLWAIKSELRDQIRRWRNRKTKIVGDYEAEAAAGEYAADLTALYAGFVVRLRSECTAACADIMQRFQDRYTAQGFDRDYAPANVSYVEPMVPELPSLASQFTALRQISFEEPKGDLLRLFLKSPSKEEREPVRVVTCFYEQWRTVAEKTLLPIAHRYIEASTDALRQYYDALAQAYHVHLTALIAAQTQEKESVSAQLSDEERMLQDDYDWLGAFQDKLTRIERG